MPELLLDRLEAFQAEWSVMAPEAARDAIAADSHSDVARACGLDFGLPPDLQALYAKSGHALPGVNGDASWTLPIPATFVIGRDGRVLARHVDPDYRTRMEPSAAIAALRAPELVG